MSYTSYDSSASASTSFRPLEQLEDRRLMSAGQLDATFGSGGKYLPNNPDLPPAFILPTDFAVQGDGKVLVTGFGVHDIGTVFRLTADGKIDSTFAGGNVLAGSGQGGYWAQAQAVAVGPNGRIVVAGHDGGINDDLPNASTLVVYKSDGSIDKTFDTDGVIDTTAFGNGFVDVAFQSDGKILALGKKLVRFNADGSVDKTFGGGDGVVDVDGRKLVIDSSGRVVVLGLNALFRYTTSGAADTTFDGDGIRPSVKGYDLALAPDGDLLVIGNGGNNDQLSRFNSNGSVDTAFGNSGNLFAPGGRTLAVNASNIFVGSSPGSPVIPFSDLTVDAYTQNGRRDATFGSAGRVQTDFGLTKDTMVGLTFQQGKLLALGYADVNLSGGGTQSEPALARYQLGATTAPRTPFNGVPINVTDGVVTTQFDKGGEGVAYHDTESQNLGGAFRPSEGVDIQYTGDGFHPYVVSFVKAGEWLEYTVNVPETASYDINILAAHLKNGGKFHLTMDGKDITGSLTVPNTGSWTTFRNVTKRGVSLTAGTHVLRLAFDANGDLGYVGNFDKIGFNKVVAPGPQSPFYATPGKDGQRFEFEDYDRGGEGVAFHDTDNLNQGDYGGRPADGVDIQSTTDAGGGANVGFLKAGEWLEYTMDFTQSGPFALDVRAASQGQSGTFSVQVDGVTVGTFSTSDTGGWQSYKTLTKTGINVAQGRHVVRFQMNTNGSMGYTANLNWFEFRKV